MAPSRPAELPQMAALLMQGLALHQAGRLAEAEKIYSQILAVDPDQFDSPTPARLHISSTRRFCASGPSHRSGAAEKSRQHSGAEQSRHRAQCAQAVRRGAGELRPGHRRAAGFCRGVDSIAAIRCRNCSGTTRRWQVSTARLPCGPITSKRIIIGPIRCTRSSGSTKRWRVSTARWRCGRAMSEALINRGVTLHALARFRGCAGELRCRARAVAGR